MFLSHFTKCTRRNKRSCITQHFSKTSPCPAETKRFNVSESTKLQKPSSFLYCGHAHTKFSPFDKQKNKLCGASAWLWARLTAAAPNALKLFRSAAIHLLSSASERLHPRPPTTAKKKLQKSGVLLFTGSKWAWSLYAALRLVTEVFSPRMRQIKTVHFVTWSSSFSFQNALQKNAHKLATDKDLFCQQHTSHVRGSSPRDVGRVGLISLYTQIIPTLLSPLLSSPHAFSSARD